jgi:DNA polymerase I-like protein with 3'-5' exonuclease and polymerase domains/uracil-DNA glycosylase
MAIVRWSTREEEQRQKQQKHVSPLFPLSFPGIPEPGSFFPQLADMLYKEVGRTVEENTLRLYEDILYGKTSLILVEVKPGMRVQVDTCAGHLYGDPYSKGPVKSSVMVIGKMPRPDDLYAQADPYGGVDENFVASVMNPVSLSGAFFRQQCLLRGVDPSNWYVTNLFKGLHPENPVTGSTLKAAWLKEWYPIIHQELRLVQPDYLLLLGADVAKAFLGNKTKIEDVNGRVLDFTYSYDVNNPELQKTASVVVTTAPSAVVRSSGTKELNNFEFAFTKFASLCGGHAITTTEEVDHRVIRTIEEWRDLVKEIHADCEGRLLAIDAEWQGQHPQCSGAYLRSIQFSWKEKTAAALVLRTIDGDPYFSDEELAEIKQSFYGLIRSFIVAGHYVDSDFEFLIAEGFIPSIAHVPTVPRNAAEYRSRILNGEPCLFDTAIAAHACDETQDFSLTAQYLQNCPEVPRYDYGLEEWKANYCHENKLKKKEFPGYGIIPEEVLMPYACYDVDVTRRLATIYIDRLDHDRMGFDCWRPFQITMSQFNAFLEINCNGILVDRERLDALTRLYDAKTTELLADIRQTVRWHDLNLNSTYQLRELLFGEQLNGKNGVTLRPSGALSLYLTPIATTGSSTPWSTIVQQRREHMVSPSCDKGTLAILYREGGRIDRRLPNGQIVTTDWTELLGKIRDYKMLSRLGSYVLKMPENGASDFVDSPEFDGGDDELVYDGGIPSHICDLDGRLRTHMYATKETGRASSARPSLQNLSKRREADYARIVGDKYIGPLRSILKASDGHLLIAADFKGAELFACAMLSGDSKMLEHVTRNQLEEDDPNYYDIHSQVAVAGMRLNCEPTKAGLASIGKAYLRIAAKTVIFGLMYGRQAKAVAMALREEGTYVTIEEAEALLQAIRDTYPEAIRYLQECARAVTRNYGQPGYLYGAYGRLRRCPPLALSDRDRIGAFERQFMNFPMQNFVADTMARSLCNLFWERYRFDISSKLLLQVHDEVLIESPYEYVKTVYDEFLDKCMVEMCPVYPLNIYGVSMNKGPFRMGIDKSVYYRWGENLKREQWEVIVSGKQ